MIKSRRWLALGIVGGAMALGGWMTMRPSRPIATGARAAASPRGDTIGVPSDAELLESDLAFYVKRAAEDPESAIDRATLAALYMQRARANGSMQDVARAESLSTHSLALRAERNEGAVATLAASLLARHAFAEALKMVRRADSVAPGSASTIALLAEIEMEVGQYDSARVHFERVRPEAHRATIGARLARWYEISGRVDLARGILRRTIAQLDSRDDLAREQRSWFHFRLGELDLRAGALDSADASFRRGLAQWPDDYRILGGMARLSAARGEWRDAIAHGERAVAIQLDPATLGVISEAHRALGDTAEAAQWAQAMSVSALSQPGPIHRTWGLFLLDHGSARDRREVLARARRELRERHDVYGHDLYAWALYRDGRHREASDAMTRALSQGTEDPHLDVHAGLIAWAVGDSAGAELHLTRALRVAPQSANPTWTAARAVLDSLAQGRRG